MTPSNPHRWYRDKHEFYLYDTKRRAFISPADRVTDFRGDVTRVTTLSRTKEYNGTAKVCVAPNGWEYYSTVYDLEALPVIQANDTYQLDIYNPESMIRQLECVHVTKVDFDTLTIHGELLGADNRVVEEIAIPWRYVFIANRVGEHDLIPVH